MSCSRSLLARDRQARHLHSQHARVAAAAVRGPADALDLACGVGEWRQRSLSPPVPDHLRALQAQTPADDDRPVYAGSVLAGALPVGCLSWSPLSAFTQLRPPLPVHPSAFALAGGLALREEDR